MAMSKEERAARKAEKKASDEKKSRRDRQQSEKRWVAARNIPSPCIQYSVGDRVKYGNWDWSAVLKVYENGLYYKLVSVTRKTNRNIPDESELKIHYIAWFDFTPYRSLDEWEQTETLTQDEDIRFSFQQRDINSLLAHYFGKYGIDLEPEYQRGNVWTLEQKQSLIDSIFHNVDIGKFCIIKRPWGPDGMKPLTPKLYEMLDGKQRLTAIVEFFTGRFSYKGKYYNDLKPHDKQHFKYYSLSYAETDPLTDEQKYRYFLKLNTTGTPVDPAHMDKVRKMLEEIENG